MTDPFLHAGLMARATLEANAAFAGVFAASPQVGCFFESRASTAANATTATLNGGFPVNYPRTWLRLRRAGNVFTGFASLDGQTWTQLGTATITLPAQLQVGLALTSGNAQAVSAAQFRDYGNTASLVTGAFVRDREPIGPTSRPDAPANLRLPFPGAVAQLVAHLVRNEGVRGSNPLSSTTHKEPRVGIAGGGLSARTRVDFPR